MVTTHESGAACTIPVRCPQRRRRRRDRRLHQCELDAAVPGAAITASLLIRTCWVVPDSARRYPRRVCGGSALLLLPPQARTGPSADRLERVAERGVALLEDVVRAVDHYAARREHDLADVVEQHSETGVGLLEDLAHVRLGVGRVVVDERKAPRPRH